MGEKGSKDWKKWIFWFSFAVASIVVYKTIDSVSAVFSWVLNLVELLEPFLMAALLAYMLYIPARGIEKAYNNSKFKILKKHTRGLSVFTIYLIMIILIFIIINFILPSLTSSVVDLANNLPNYYNSAVKYFDKLPDDSIWVKLGVDVTVKSIGSLNITDAILEWVNLENISQYIQGIVGAANVIFDLFVTFVVSVYLLLERADIKSFLKNLFKTMFDKKTYTAISRYYNKTNKIFYCFITSQIIDAFIVGIITSIAMLIMNVKYAVLLGFLVGLFNIIPYFGAIVAIIIAVLITIFTGGITQAIWLAVIVIILQQIDANIINPRILGNSLNLSPILVIFAVTIGGAYFGVLGMFLGVPVIALIKIIVLDRIELKNQNQKS